MRVILRVDGKTNKTVEARQVTRLKAGGFDVTVLKDGAIEVWDGNTRLFTHTMDTGARR